MNTKRVGLALSAAVVAALTLSSCAANEPTTPATSGSGSSSTAAAPLNGTLNGEGSSAQTNAQAAWIKSFQTANSGVTVNYDPEGSGAGRTAFEAGGVDFAGSDGALPAAELSGKFAKCAAKAIDIPVYVSSIAIVFNVAGVTSLNLDSDTLAKIFKGTIKNWDDPAIKALNSGVTFPNLAIDPVHRSDKSGTTNNFTDYLNQASPSIWTDVKNDVFPYNTGDGAAKGSGVVAAVTSGKGTIGYVDNSSAAKLNVAKIKVGSDYVAPSAAAASKTAETSPLATGLADNDIVVNVNRKTTDSTEYPITLVSYFIACQQYGQSTTGALVSAYAKYLTSTQGQTDAATAAGSAPMTGALLTKAEAAAASIK